MVAYGNTCINNNNNVNHDDGNNNNKCLWRDSTASSYLRIVSASNTSVALFILFHCFFNIGHNEHFSTNNENDHNYNGNNEQCTKTIITKMF